MTLFDELLAILDTSEFEDLGSLRLAGADSLNGALKLKLKVFLNEDVHVSQRWESFAVLHEKPAWASASSTTSS